MKKINLIFFLILFLASSNSYAEKWHINMKKKEKKPEVRLENILQNI